MNFKGSLYDYKIALGEVLDSSQINWNLHITVGDWKEAKEIIEVWHKGKENPAINISLDYRGDKIVETQHGNFKALRELMGDIEDL